VAAPQKRRTCDQVFDEFLIACDSRVAKRDLAYVTSRGYAKLLAQIWRPEIGPRIFDEIRYSELARIVNAYQWSKKTYNNAISVIRCAFDYGYRDHPEKHNPASGLTCLRMTKKDRPVVTPFTIQEAETLIAKLHADWGEAIGNYDEFRFFTGLRPSGQIALLETDYDARRGVLSVTKARVLRRDKDRTKTQEDRDVELCPRGLEVLRPTGFSAGNTSRPAKSTISISSSWKTAARSATRRSPAGAGARVSMHSIFAGAGPITRGIPP
jgi:integrase